MRTKEKQTVSLFVRVGYRMFNLTNLMDSLRWATWRATTKISLAAVVFSRCCGPVFQVGLPRFHQTRVPADPCWKGSVQIIVFPRWSHQHTPKVQVGVMVLILMWECACVVVALIEVTIKLLDYWHFWLWWAKTSNKWRIIKCWNSLILLCLCSYYPVLYFWKFSRYQALNFSFISLKYAVVMFVVHILVPVIDLFSYYKMCLWMLYVTDCMWGFAFSAHLPETYVTEEEKRSWLTYQVSPDEFKMLFFWLLNSCGLLFKEKKLNLKGLSQMRKHILSPTKLVERDTQQTFSRERSVT